MLSFHEEQEVLPESFLANFPSLIKIDIHKKVTDPSVAKSMMACLLSSLKANGMLLALGTNFPDHMFILGCKADSGWLHLHTVFVCQPEILDSCRSWHSGST